MQQLVKYLVRDVVLLAIRELTKNGMPGASDRYAEAHKSLSETGILTLPPTTSGKLQFYGALCVDGEGFGWKHFKTEHRFRWSEVDGAFAVTEVSKSNCIAFKIWKTNPSYGKKSWFSDNKSQFASRRFNLMYAYGLGHVNLAHILNAVKQQAESQWTPVQANLI